MIIKKIGLMAAVTVLTSLTLVGCDESGQITKQGAGQLAGGVLGGVLGAQVSGRGRTAAIIGGALLGGYLGGEVGRSMDRADRDQLVNTLEHTPVNQTNRWTHHDSGRQVVVMPVQNYQYRGLYCRRFRMVVLMEGRERVVYGRACKNAYGQWEIVR